MKIFAMILGIALGAGNLPSTAQAAAQGEPFQRRFSNFRLVKKGMTRQEVDRVISPEIIIGYEQDASDSEQFHPLILKSLQREEEKILGGRTCKVLYFLEGIRAADGQIADEELFPVVLENEVVVGMGWDFLAETFGGDGRSQAR